jgi:hypothetical protein
MKKAIPTTSIEMHRINKQLPGLPTEVACEYLVLDGTRSQVENLAPWNRFKEIHPNYIYFYINMDDVNGDPTRFDIVDYAIPEGEPGFETMRGSWSGAEPGDTMLVRYNAKENIMTEDIIFVKGNIEEDKYYYIIEE